MSYFFYYNNVNIPENRSKQKGTTKIFISRKRFAHNVAIDTINH